MKFSMYFTVFCLFNLDYVKDPSGTQYWRNRIMSVAYEFPKLNFACGSFKAWAGVINEMGLNVPDNHSPLILIFDDDDYVMQAEFDPQGKAFTQFIQDFQAGNLKKHVKSEPEPARQGANIKLTGNNFNKYINGKTHAFIYFYTPWCAECKKLFPKWEIVANTFIKDKNTTIAQINAASNDLPSFLDVTEVPTFIFIPQDKLNYPVRYTGARETKKLIEFVNYEKSKFEYAFYDEIIDLHPKNNNLRHFMENTYKPKKQDVKDEL